jgi:hypothetical protein
VSEVTRYGASWGGVVGDTAAGPQVQAQEVIERVPGPGGSVTERRSVRLPAQSDPRTLGPLTKVSETVCTGKCQ